MIDVKRHFRLLLLLTLIPSAQCISSFYYYEESDEAFPNPMKGFRPSRFIEQTEFPLHEYATVYKHYIPYNWLEENSNDGVKKIIRKCDEMWTGIEEKNIKVIPRVILFYPGKGYFFPDDLASISSREDWFGTELKDRIVNMIHKLGEAWDNDPRVAAVELGLWGKWGEHHIHEPTITLPERIPKEFWEPMGAAAVQAFQNKTVLVRYPGTFTCFQNRLGMIWDSFALPNDLNWAETMLERNTWITQMISGEVAYDWGDQSLLGGSPNATLSSKTATDWVIEWVEKVHCSSLGWIDLYDSTSTSIASNAKQMQKSLGYRFVVKNANIPKSVHSGGSLTFDFTVENVGSAPFYYNWPIEVSLLNESKIPEHNFTLSKDIREWMPGKAYQISLSMDIPCALPDGVYTLALSILDPSGNAPSLRFANTNYYNGGRTPLAKVGVGITPSNQDLGSFDRIKKDNSLSYSLKKTISADEIEQ